MSETSVDSAGQLAAAINKSADPWRTPRAVATDTGVSPEEALKIMEGSETFVRAQKSNKDGQPLFTTRASYRARSTLKQRIFDALTHKITG